MDEAFNVCAVGAPVSRFAVEAERHDVLWLNHFRAARARKQEEVGVVGMAHADVSERIDDALIRKDAIGGDEFSNDLVEI